MITKYMKDVYRAYCKANNISKVSFQDFGDESARFWYREGKEVDK